MNFLKNLATPSAQTETAGGAATPTPLPKTAPSGHTHPDYADTNPSTLKPFLFDVLPRSGNFSLWTKYNKKHHWTGNCGGLIALHSAHIDIPDTYFATAAFGNKISDTTGDIARTQDNVIARRCLHGDLDCGPGKPYASQAEALQALQAFEATTGLTPTYVVNSGRGVHVYYALNQDITGAQWKPLAQGLADLAKGHSLNLDSACTTDSARVLRAPGSLHNNGQRVGILTHNPAAKYAPDQLAHLLEVSGVSVMPTPAPATRRTTGINADVLEDAERYDSAPADFDLIVKACPAVRWAVENPAATTEPYWRATLGIVKFCAGAEEIAHQISKGHPSYDPAETQRKLEGWTAPPTTCQTFAGHNPSACAACPLRGTIKSPIRTGYMTATAMTAQAGRQATTRKELEAALPDWRYRRTEDSEGNVRNIKTTPHNTVPNVLALATLTGWCMRYNEMTKRVELTRDGTVIPQDDHDNVALTLFGDDAERAGMSRNGLDKLVDAAATQNRYHPVLEWLGRNPWDGITRLRAFWDTLELSNPRKGTFRDILLNLWMLQCIGALCEPDGIAAHGVLVLSGEQGCGKSYWFAHLCSVAGAVGLGLHLDPDDKDSVLKITRHWIAELGELDSTTKRSDMPAVKAFISNSEDVVRLPYARRDTVYRRRTVLGGTVNGTGFLVDDTGNRRFWVLEVARCQVLPPQAMQQVWAEYLHKYRQGERWHLDRATLEELNTSNLDHTSVDPLREKIATRWDWASVASGLSHQIF